MNHPNWNENWSKYRAFNYKKLIQTYEKLGIGSLPRNAKILDLGCGSGEFIRILMERGFTDIEGWEPQADLVQLAKMPSVKLGDCLSTPPIGAAFDAVIISGVLHHLKSFEEVTLALTNVMRLLRPGGYFFSVEPRKTLARTLATKVMLNVPIWTLPARVQIDRILVLEETVELNRWLSFERQVLPKAVSLGFTARSVGFDWKSAYLVLTKR
jgi:2-polyprenyl-3-methyl-5-hydroxy-6-metoxy-1,4-benzoquinol methylase